MSLQISDIEGARPKYYERQQQIDRAKQYNQGYSNNPYGEDGPAMNYPESYSAQINGRQDLLSQQQQQQRAPSNYQEQFDLQPISGREKSIYQMEYQPRSADILQSANAKPVDSMQSILRNPVSYGGFGSQVNKNGASGQKMISEKKYQEQLVLQEVQKFKEQQILIEQEKRKRELEYREKDLAKKQKEADQLRELQLQQEEKMNKQKEIDEMRSQQERERQSRVKEEIQAREKMLQDKEKELKQKEIQIAQTPLKNLRPPSNNLNPQFPQLAQNIDNQFQPSPQQYESQKQYRNSPLIPSNQGRVESQNEQNPFMPQQLSQSSVLNGKYYQTPLENNEVNRTLPVDNEQQRRVQSNNRSQLIARSVLGPMSALLSQPESKPQQIQQEPQKSRQVKVLAIMDSDSKSRDDVTKFFQVRGIQEYQIFGAPGGPAGLMNDKGWLDSFFSCFSFMRQVYDFSDIFVFSSTESVMGQMWFSSIGSQKQSYPSIKQFHISTLKQIIEILKQRTPQYTRIQGFLLEQRGLSERVI